MNFVLTCFMSYALVILYPKIVLRKPPPQILGTWKIFEKFCDPGTSELKSEFPTPPFSPPPQYMTKRYVGNLKEYVKNMKKYVKNMKEYVRNMKNYVKNMKEYVRNMKESLPSYIVSEPLINSDFIPSI